MTEEAPPPATTHRRLIHRPEPRRWFQQHRDRYPWLHPVVQTLVAVAGVTLILAGIVMIVVPGPGWLTVFAGFAILATEFRWARRVTRQSQAIAHRAYTWFTRGRRARWAHRWKKRGMVGSRAL